MSHLLAGEIVENAARPGAESELRSTIFIIFFGSNARLTLESRV